jgi:hypothetical protein
MLRLLVRFFKDVTLIEIAVRFQFRTIATFRFAAFKSLDENSMVQNVMKEIEIIADDSQNFCCCKYFMVSNFNRQLLFYLAQ